MESVQSLCDLLNNTCFPTLLACQCVQGASELLLHNLLPTQSRPDKLCVCMCVCMCVCVRACITTHDWWQWNNRFHALPLVYYLKVFAWVVSFFCLMFVFVFVSDIPRETYPNTDCEYNRVNLRLCNLSECTLCNIVLAKMRLIKSGNGRCYCFKYLCLPIHNLNAPLINVTHWTHKLWTLAMKRLIYPCLKKQ